MISENMYPVSTKKQIYKGLYVIQAMKVYKVVAKCGDLQARRIDKVYDSREKAERYIREQEEDEHFVSIRGIDHSIEEWKVE